MTPREVVRGILRGEADHRVSAPDPDVVVVVVVRLSSTAAAAWTRHMSASNDSADATDATRSGIAASDASAATDSTPASLFDESVDALGGARLDEPGPLLDEPGPLLDEPVGRARLCVVAWEEKTSASSGCASRARDRTSRSPRPSANSGAAIPAPRLATRVTSAAALAATATAARDGPCGVDHAGPFSTASTTASAASATVDSIASVSASASASAARAGQRFEAANLRDGVDAPPSGADEPARDRRKHRRG